MKYRLYRAKGNTGKVLPKWKAKFFSDTGAYLKAETLYTDKGKSRDRAEEICRLLDKEQTEVAAGIPQISKRPIRELIAEYLSIRSVKGKGGIPWCDGHKTDAAVKLDFWVKVLDLKTLADIRLVDVERVLAGMPLAGTTRNKYQHFLAAFVNWCIRVRYMPYSPLQGFTRYNQEPTFKRAAFTVAELRTLLDVTPPDRRLSYQMALLTGMRLSELRSLQVCDLDPEKRIVKLSAAAAKNRRAAWFYLPEEFTRELVDFTKGKGPQDSLLDLYKRGAERIREDMGRAGIEWNTPRGVLDFHSLRVTFATLLNEYGEDVKVIQDLMRHSTPILTLSRYTKSNEARQRMTIDRLAEIVPGPAKESQEKRSTKGTRGEKSANA